MKQHKKALLSIAAVAAIGTAGIGGTYAAFTDEENENVSFDSGSIVVGTDLTGFSTANMVIGDVANGTLSVSNDGDNKIKTLTIEGDPGTTPIASGLANNLKITITDDSSGDVLAEESLGTFNARVTPTALESGAAGTAFSDNYTIRLELESTGTDPGDNNLQNLEGSEKFTIKAVQRDGVVRTVGEGTIEL